ncbi:MAG: DNA adenine methylase [Candidatus Pacebacteria bacterium]|nr:DNA adenine methylase [Candidatus Paceibacterota bacterium]
MFYSPLRYPGGKNKLAKFISKVCEINNVSGHYVEPYAGGASVALFLLIENKVSKITINDYDEAIFAFWYSVLNDTDRLCRKIHNTEITLKNWRKQKEIQKNKAIEKDLLKLGFSTFFLNRTNYSGIINGGVIGGKKQSGKYKIDCRFNKKELIKRIKLIAKYKEKIIVSNLDALELIKKVRKTKNTIFYFDPPYYLMGPSLYMNHYKHKDHKKVSDEIKKIKNAHWIVSYDDIPEIRFLYKRFKSIKFMFLHMAYRIRKGKEIIVFSNNLSLPKNNRLIIQ